MSRSSLSFVNSLIPAVRQNPTHRRQGCSGPDATIDDLAATAGDAGGRPNNFDQVLG